MRKVVINGIDTRSLPKITQSECEELLQKTKEGDKRGAGQVGNSKSQTCAFYGSEVFGKGQRRRFISSRSRGIDESH